MKTFGISRAGHLARFTQKIRNKTLLCAQLSLVIPFALVCGHLQGQFTVVVTAVDSQRTDGYRVHIVQHETVDNCIRSSATSLQHADVE